MREWSDFWSFLPGREGEDARNHVAWSLVQQIYTPETISAPEPPPGEAPYAGLLYVDSLIYTRHEDWGQVWHLRAGMVGPSTLGDRTQIQFHELIDADEPMGWDTQLPDEPFLNLGYTFSYEWVNKVFGNGAMLRVSPLVNAELGTFATALGGGVFVEYGWNLPDALGVSAIGQGFNSALVVGAAPTDHWEISFHAGIGGYGIAHYLPLDGTVFRDSRSQDRDPFAGQISAGIALRHKRFAASLGASLLSGSFSDLENSVDYGVLSVAWYL